MLQSMLRILLCIADLSLWSPPLGLLMWVRPHNSQLNSNQKRLAITTRILYCIMTQVSVGQSKLLFSCVFSPLCWVMSCYKVPQWLETSSEYAFAVSFCLHFHGFCIRISYLLCSINLLFHLNPACLLKLRGKYPFLLWPCGCNIWPLPRSWDTLQVLLKIKWDCLESVLGGVSAQSVIWFSLCR